MARFSETGHKKADLFSENRLMDLRSRLEVDMKAALKARDSIRLQTVRGIRGAVRNKEIEVRDTLGEEGILRVIRTLVKQRVEAIEQYEKGGRPELAAKEGEEREILEGYLPAGPDEAEMERVVREQIAEVGATSPKDMGRVIKPVLDQLGPAADGKLVSQLVRRLLSAAD